MKSLRRWKIDATKPYSLFLTADARLSQTDYTDDQVWQLSLGILDEPTLALQTHYGGRVGLASIVPMWVYEGRVIYQSQAYISPPIITQFAPNYLKAEAQLLPTVELRAEYWAMDSHAVGAVFTLNNISSQRQQIRLDLFAHVGAEGGELPLNVISTHDKSVNALHIGKINRLNAVVLLENGTSDAQAERSVSPKIGVDIVLEPNKLAHVRFIHVGLPEVMDSFNHARTWLKEDWSPYFDELEMAATALPEIQLGNEDFDLTVASSINAAVQAIVRPTQALPFASFVGTRIPSSGFSMRGDGSDQNRYWDGQDPMLAYILISSLITISPEIAKGILQNYIAVQATDGWIDRKPGLAGQKQDLLCMPLLARIAWGIYELTDDQPFLDAIYPKLALFFERWFKDDVDRDGDGFPEWQSERQMGYVLIPSFATAQSWAQGADIRTVEAPDLITYVLSEAIILRKMAQTLGKKADAKTMDSNVRALQKALTEIWDGERFVYRDRDTHQTSKTVVVLDDGRGEDVHTLNATLNPPNRLIIKVIGGVNLTPNISLSIEGIDTSGKSVRETASAKQFVWHHRQGVYTTATVFSQVNSIQCDGLSRVYRIRAQTLDTTGLDVSALLPLWSTGVTPEQAQSLVRLVTDKTHFWQPNGIPMVSAQDPHYDPSNANGGGGIWPFWSNLIIEGLWDAGEKKLAVEALTRLINVQMRVLKQKHQFSEFYHSDKPIGLGTSGHLGGIVPIYLLMRMLGAQIISSGKVWAGGAFVWPKGVTIKQHGVTVKRTKKGTDIRFPSGHKVKLATDAEWQMVLDPKPIISPLLDPKKLPVPPKSFTPKEPQKVIIEVKYEDQ